MLDPMSATIGTCGDCKPEILIYGSQVFIVAKRKFQANDIWKNFW